MDQKNRQELQTLAGSLRGLRCWYVSCGGCTIPTFQLALGGKIPRQAPLRNSAHPEEYRNYEGEANLLVWCTWRLDGADRPVTSSDDSADAIERGLTGLLGCDVEDAQVTPPAWDLTVRFSGGLQLRVFGDHVPGDQSFDGNWELWLRQVAVLVGPGDRCVIEPRTDTPVGTSARL